MNTTDDGRTDGARTGVEPYSDLPFAPTPFRLEGQMSGEAAAAAVLSDEHEVRAWLEAWAASPSFAQLIERARPQIARQRGTEVDAEDAIQESFAKLWEKPGRLVGKAPTDSFMYTVLVNQGFDLVRTDMKHRGAMPEAGADIYAAPAGAEDTAEQQLDTQQLMLVLNGMEPRLRDVCQYRLIHGLSNAETATRMGVSTRTVQNLMNEFDVVFARDWTAFEAGELCAQHLAAGEFTARRHLALCPVCSARRAKLRDAAPALAPLFPIGAANGGVFSQLMNHVQNAILQLTTPIVQRYQEASIATRAGAVAVSAALLIGGPTAIVTQTGDESPQKAPETPAAQVPADGSDDAEPSPPASSEQKDEAAQDKNANANRNNVDSDEKAGDGSPALTPEATAKPLPEAPASSAPNGSGGSDGGVGDLAP